VSEEDLKYMKVPDNIAKGFEAFQYIYKKNKPMRKLNYSENVGLVKLTIEFDDGEKMQFNVLPIQAIVVSNFSRDPGCAEIRFSVDQLC